jgi:hypothetical protein
MKAYQRCEMPSGETADCHDARPGTACMRLKVKDLESLVPNLGVFEGFGDEQLRFAALKMAIDGGVGSKTAMMNEPWIDGTETRSLYVWILPLEKYFRIGMVQAVDWIHCCGRFGTGYRLPNLRYRFVGG